MSVSACNLIVFLAHVLRLTLEDSSTLTCYGKGVNGLQCRASGAFKRTNSHVLLQRSAARWRGEPLALRQSSPSLAFGVQPFERGVAGASVSHEMQGNAYEHGALRESETLHEAEQTPKLPKLPKDLSAKSREDSGRPEYTNSHGDDHSHGANPLDATLGASLICYIAFTMCIFYMVNYPDEDIQKASYCMISDSISIFCAVLLYKGICDCIRDWVNLMISAIIRHCLFLFLIFIFINLLGILQQHESMEATAHLGAHLIGFAAAECFTATQKTWFSSSSNPALTLILNIALVVVIYCFLHTALDYFLYRQTKSMSWNGSADASNGSGGGGGTLDLKTNYLKQCQKCESSAFAFCLGFLFSQFTKFVAAGEMPSLHTVPQGKTQSQVNMLFLGTCVFLGTMVSAAFITNHIEIVRRSTESKKLLGFMQKVSARSAAWNLLFVGEWQWFVCFPRESQEKGIMILAFVVTIFSMVIIVVVDKVADNCSDVVSSELRALIRCISISVGLSWEKAFYAASHSVTAIFSNHNKEERHLEDLALTLALVGIVLPSWRYFILPRAMSNTDEEKSHTGESASS